MARRVFYSFHHDKDGWRTAQVRGLGFLEANRTLPDTEWAEVKRCGEPAIRQWIDRQMAGRSCVIVLIGTRTAGRRWVEYEIRKAWSENCGLLGVRVHRLLGKDGRASTKGHNPFRGIRVGGVDLGAKVPVHDPVGTNSKDVYSYIGCHLEQWVENAISDRDRR